MLVFTDRIIARTLSIMPRVRGFGDKRGLEGDMIKLLPWLPLPGHVFLGLARPWRAEWSSVELGKSPGNTSESRSTVTRLEANTHPGD